MLPALQDALIGVLAALLALGALNGLEHQKGNDRAFIHPFECGVESILDVLRDAEIDGGHGDSRVVEIFNNIFGSVF